MDVQQCEDAKRRNAESQRNRKEGMDDVEIEEAKKTNIESQRNRRQRLDEADKSETRMKDAESHREQHQLLTDSAKKRRSVRISTKFSLMTPRSKGKVVDKRQTAWRKWFKSMSTKRRSKYMSNQRDAKLVCVQHNCPHDSVMILDPTLCHQT
jgi:hypothetical protein